MTARWRDGAPKEASEASPLEARARELFAGLPDPPLPTEARRRAIEERLAGAASPPRRWVTTTRVAAVAAALLLVVVGAVRWPRAVVGELRIPDGAHTEIKGDADLRLAIDGPAQLRLVDRNRRKMRLTEGQLTVASGGGAASVEAGGALVSLSAGSRARVSIEGSRVIVAAYSAGVSVSWPEAGGTSTTLSIGGLWRSTTGVENAPPPARTATTPAPVVAPPVRPVERTADRSGERNHRQVAAVPPTLQTTLGSEAELMGSAVQALRANSDPRAALALVERYHDRYPAGALADEALRIKVEALVRLGRRDEALAALDGAPHLADDQRGEELRMVRGELRLDAHHPREALDDFAAVAVGGSPALVERAKSGQARARLQLAAP